MEFKAKTFDELTNREVYELMKARTQIFVVEQNIVYQDMDGIDYESLHCFFEEDGEVTACLRAFYLDEANGLVKVGRVLTLQHGNGLGRKLMENSLTAIRQKMNCKKLRIDAQVYATGFYEKFGFKTVSEEFLEDGIPHITMELT